MPHLFFDTSALVKRYYPESGTQTVDSLIESSETKIVISSLSIIETTSAFRRKHNQDDIPWDSLSELLATFFDEALSSFLIVPTDESLFGQSFELVLEDDLRTLDSLQLSAALDIAAATDEFRFVCADSELCSVASNRGLETINPTENGDR
jgi:predicted nucleic acid-binding protein